ncbi:MAG: hypothetical protein ACRD2A_04755 [Vicinamibacterales bacterium]
MKNNLSYALVALLGGGVMVMGQAPLADPLKSPAERYVKLVLAVGQHDADYVDAFYGPPEWKKEVETAKPSLPTIDQQASAIERELSKAPSSPPVARDTELWKLRVEYLARQLSSLRARVAMLQGKRFTFDEESRALYDAVAPTRTAADFEAVLKQLDARLAGSGSLIERYEAFKRAFVISPARVDRVFKEAIRSCRERTLRHVELPLEERFTVEYVTNKSWSGYNWYQGQYRSVIQVNTDLPIYIDRAIDLACHEGYPGHHVYNALLEKHLVRDRGWVEFSVYPLFSPQSLIAEGTANYGIEVAFSAEDRLNYERDVLFPLAGLDPAKVKDYYDVFALVERLSYAGNEAARQYLNGAIDRTAAADWLEKYAMYPRARAEQRVRFIDQYRSYVINYNVGKDLVRDFVNKRAGRNANEARRWQEFAALLSSPRLPSGLK